MQKFIKLRNPKTIIVWSFSAMAAFLIFTSFKPGTENQKDMQTNQPMPPRLEMPDDPYVPVPHEGRTTSPAYRFSSSNFFATQVNVFDTLNILGDAANEPSIAVDPTDPNRIAIGWRQFDTVNSNFRQAGYAFTTDGGQTWTFPGVIEQGIFRSDPVLDSDSAGTFYYNSLTVVSSDYLCDVFKSTDGGATWDMGTFAQGGDKQWMVIDKTGGISDGHIYAYWTQFYSICYPGFFTRSANHGASYENCVEITDSPYWGTLAVDADGRLYVGGVGGFGNFLVARSSNARDSSQVVSWDYSNAVLLDGNIGFGGGPNPGGLLGQTWIAVDRSNGPNHGNVYLLCSVERYSVSDPLDVMFSSSTDSGVTWSAPVRVNDDPGINAWQWFGTMSVGPDGRIDVVWLDTRDNPGTFLSSLYYAYSLDGGATWSSNERLSGAFDPHVGWPQQNKMGDYFDMVSDESGAHLAWAGTFNGEQDVYYGHITPSITAIEDGNDEVRVQEYSLFQNYPNPFNPTTRIRFSLAKSSNVKIEVFAISGEKILTLLDDYRLQGYHTVDFDGRNFSSGVYLYRIQAGNYMRTEKMVLLK